MSDQQLERNLDDDEQSIIDVFDFDDSAEDKWLCSLASRRSSVDGKVEDLNAWLHADLQDTEPDLAENGSKKAIDTRTFTRMKRRSNRLIFDGTDANVSPETNMPPSVFNVWKNHTIPESPTQEQPVLKEKRDAVPMMLRPKSNQVLAALLSEGPSSISSQASIEAFRNVARSKEGLSSLISDMSEPDVNSFLMNISQPSLLYSSIISDGKGDESVQATGIDSFTDSQILTQSMMEASMFKEVQDTTILSDFLKDSDNCNSLEDRIFAENSNTFNIDDETFVADIPGDKTYVNISDRFSDTFHVGHAIANRNFVANNNSKLNGTFTSVPSANETNSADSTRILSPPSNSMNSTQIISNAPRSMNSTLILSKGGSFNSVRDVSFECDIPELLPQESLVSTTHLIDNENKTDATFEVKSTSSSPTKKRALNETFQALNSPTCNTPRLSVSPEHFPKALNETFDTIPNLRAELLKEVQRSGLNKMDGTFTEGQSPNLLTNNKLDVTYDRPNSAEASYDAEVHDATYVQVPSLHQPECQSVRTSLNATYDSVQIDSKLGHTAADRRIGYGKSNNTLQKFNTFTKKSIMHIKKNSDENNANSTFIKPVDQLPRQIQPPRRLSKLPNLFQKSNPNLGSSLQPLKKCTLNPKSGFCKGSQPNIASNMYQMSRFQSEQRLQHVKSNEFSLIDGTSRSMESIESTVSALSAPDLDERLSMCSDSSKKSYTIKQPKNLELLKKLVAEEQVIGSTPVVKGRRVLENTWFEEKDLPSPILKNGKNSTESAYSRSSSPLECAEFNAKTSSPLTTRSTNSDSVIHEIGIDDGCIEAVKENIELENVKLKQIKAPSSVSNVTNATKLRRPMNYTGGPNKAANGAVSGIPRPASRIPAPKFSRPKLK